MTLFEYLAIAFSLVFSFSALRLVSGLPYALAPERRYPVHLFNVFIALVTTASYFWVFWSLRDVSWTYPLFMSALLGPAILYYLACVLIPESPSTVASWREHYYMVRRRYFLGICAWSIVLSVNTTILVGLPLLHPVRAAHVAVFVGGVLGAASDGPTLHASLVIGGVILLLCAAILYFLPGSLAA